MKKLPALYSRPPKQRKEEDNHTPKKAFDSVMEFYPAETYVDLVGSEAERRADRARIKESLRLKDRFNEIQAERAEAFDKEELRKAKKRPDYKIKTFEAEPYDFYDARPVKNKKGKAQGVVAAKGTPVKNPTAPSMTDFKIDVEKQVRKVIRTHAHMVKFIKRYIFDIEDLTKDEQHLFAGFEQRIGRLFIRAKIHPLGKYLVSIRKDKASQ